MVNTAGTGNPDLKHEAGAAGHRVADTAKQEARGVASEAKYQVRNLADRVGSEVRSQASTQQHRAAGGLRDVGSQFSEMAATSPRTGVARDLVETVGSRADSVASWLDQREPQDLLEEVKRFARRRPGVFLAIAAGAGVVIGRLTRSLASSGDDSTPSGSTPTTGTAAPRLTNGGGSYADAAVPGAVGGAHAADAPTTWGTESPGSTGTGPAYTEPLTSDRPGRGDVTGAL